MTVPSGPGFLAATRFSVGVSLNAIDWTQWTIASYRRVFDIGTDSTTALMVGSAFDAGTPANDAFPAIWYSTNGTIWSLQLFTSFTSLVSEFTSISGSDSRLWIVVGTDRPAATLVPILLTSPDGVVWIQRTLPVGFPSAGPVDSQSMRAFVGSALYIAACTSANNLHIATSVDGITWVESYTDASNTFLGDIHGNTSIYIVVGYDSNANEALVRTSTDGVTWTQQTVPSIGVFGKDYILSGVYATDSLIVAVGDNGFVTPVIITSADNGVTWVSRSSGISAAADLISVTYNSSLGIWCAEGDDNDTGSVTITYSSDGITWTHVDPIIPEAAAAAIAPFNITYPTLTAYTAFIYDDSCHLYTSYDLGTSWAESHQSVDTISNSWDDLSMAPWDGDYESMLSYDKNYLNANDSRISFSDSSGVSGTWDFIDPGGPSVPNTYKRWFSGAISGQGQIMLVTSDQTFVGGVASNSYLWRSQDTGATWDTVAEELGAQKWDMACFAAGAQVMYASYVRATVGIGFGQIVKSTNGGDSWSILTNAPPITLSSVSRGNQRLRCNSDGSVIVYIDVILLSLYVSIDSGATWTNVLTPSTGYFFGVDVGLSADGSVILVTGSSSTTQRYYWSNDFGTTWTTRTLDGLTRGYPITCNVSPDGLGFVVGCYRSADAQYCIDMSIDQGVSWIESTIDPVQNNFPVTAYMVPNQVTVVESEVHRLIRDPWDCDEWGRFQPSASIRRIY